MRLLTPMVKVGRGNSMKDSLASSVSSGSKTSAT